MFIYLASPYTPVGKFTDKEKAALREERFQDVSAHAGRLMRQGKKVFCPISHSHPIEKYGMDGEIKSEQFWLEQDFAVLTCVDELWILMLPGWDKSSGVKKETAFAKWEGIPIRHLRPGEVIPEEAYDGSSEEALA